MIRLPDNLKKILLIGTIVLLGCDVSLLFAAPGTSSANGVGEANSSPQLQQLQAQVQAQIKALQNQNASSGNGQSGLNTAPPGATQAGSTPPASSAMLSSSALPMPTTASPQGNTSASNPPQKNDILPPSPFGNTVPTEAANPNTLSTNNNTLPPDLGNTGANPPSTNATPPMPPPAYQPSSVTPDQQQGAGMTPSNTGISPSSGGTGPENANPNGSPTAGANVVNTGDINEAAFNQVLQNAMPMSPDQIQKLRSVYMASQFAAASSPVAPPRPTATSVFVDLAPGATPPVVRLSQGFVTSLVFVDSTGAPWPIEAYDIGNPSAFNIQWDKVSNTLMIQSTVLYNYGNLAVKLKGLDTPVMVTLVPGQKAVDYRVDMRIDGYGPNARASTNNALPDATGSDLLNVLDGVPPPNSKALTVEGGDCQVWLSGSKMYVRTRLSVLSPGWDATLSSADGMHAYQMQPTPMLLVSQNGQVIQLKVQGF